MKKLICGLIGLVVAGICAAGVYYNFGRAPTLCVFFACLIPSTVWFAVDDLLKWNSND